MSSSSSSCNIEVVVVVVVAVAVATAGAAQVLKKLAGLPHIHFAQLSGPRVPSVEPVHLKFRAFVTPGLL